MLQSDERQASVSQEDIQSIFNVISEQAGNIEYFIKRSGAVCVCLCEKGKQRIHSTVMFPYNTD